ncbi:MAG: GNAT family N-acetyltransferase [Lachnospiraceae bacterium]|jgi:GNAT superfamily N-acetyltransferase|nr:GNAT family N-acetyltransferase [Lachnospiraceae bacterium]
MIEYSIAKAEYLSQIIELYQQLLPDEESIDICVAQEIWKTVNTDNSVYFVALDDGKVVSSCYLAIIPDLTRNGKAIGFIENVITDECYRRKGIGKRVVEMAIEFAKEKNCYKVVLQSGVKRTEAHKFYKSIGFDDNAKKAFELRL